VQTVCSNEKSLPNLKCLQTCAGGKCKKCGSLFSELRRQRAGSLHQQQSQEEQDGEQGEGRGGS
jgi:hypothetical protein